VGLKEANAVLEKLKQEVLEANQSLVKHNLVTQTWGNVSGLDREKGLVVIKPSGVSYEELSTDLMAVVDLRGNHLEGLKPSSDTKTHLLLYGAIPDIEGVVHTHSSWCTIWAQAKKSIPVLGTTHSDYFYGNILCTREMTYDEIKQDYELNTGKVIIEAFNKEEKSPANCPGVIVNSHGPFNWGSSPHKALENAVVMEEIAYLAYHTKQLADENISIDFNLFNKHFSRKHGDNAYYGQT
jgi:L-ribulose-5-phosphate 4-epimerase